MKESRTRSSKSKTPTDTSQQAKMKGSSEKYKNVPEDNLVKSRILGENSSDLCVSPYKSEDSEQESLSSLAAGASTSIVEKHGQDESESGARHEGSGINFHPGLRLEAKDLGNDKWYGVKVVEVDWVEEDVLIHFEKWSQRYDEWISMDSPRLRSAQKPEPQPESKPIGLFNVGDEVMAAWTDNRRYPAKVKAVAPNNKFEVVFFDGFTKLIKGSKMHKLTEGELENMKEKIPSPLANEISQQTPAVYVRPKKVNIFTDVSPEGIGSKEDRRQRKRKLNVAELFVSKKRRVGSFDFSPPRDIERVTKLDLGKQGKAVGNASSPNKKESNQSFEDANQKDSSAPSDPTIVESKSESIGRSRRKSGQPVVTENGENKQSEKKSKIISGKARKRSRKLNFDEISTSSSKVSKDNESPRIKKKSIDPDNELQVGAKWEPEGDTAYVVESTAGLRRSIIIADPRLPSGWAKHTIQRRSGNSAGKWDVFLVGPKGRKFRTRAELRTYFEERKEPFEEALFDFGLGRRKLVKVAANSDTPALKPSSSSKVSRSSGKNKHSSSPIENATPLDPPLQRRIKTLLPKIRPPHSEGEKEEKSAADTEGPPPPYTTTVAANSAVKVPDPVDGQVFVGGLKIQMENDAYKCPKEGCGKTFRKENLLQMHLKHYHPEYNKFMGSTPNVADLAYARTIGENLEDLMPKSRFTFTTVTPFGMEKSARIENTRNEQEEKPQLHESGTEPAQCTPGQGVGEEMSVPSETTTSNTPLADVKEERKEPDNISKLPLSTSEQTTEMTTTDRPAEDCEDDHIDVVDDKDVQQPDSPQSSTCVSKVLRSVRKRQLSGPSPDTTLKKRKLDLLDEGDGTEEGSCSLDGSKFSSTFRINKKKLPMIHLEKLSVTTDSNGHIIHILPSSRGTSDGLTQHSDAAEEESKSPLEQSKFEHLRKEELINCTCGYSEEDGLMIQCDLCLCWQHGICNNIEKEGDVPEKYTCSICLNPYRERVSKKYLHDQDWLKEGKLPSLSFRTKNASDVNHRERLLKRSHDVTGMLLQVQHVAQGLRVKLNIAEKPDHPKLYLWAKSWEKASKLEGLKTESDIKVEDKTECNEESDKFNKRDETSVTSSTEELSLRINDSEEMDENSILPSKNTNQLDQSSNEMFNLDNTDSSAQPGVMETECDTTSSANSKKATDEGVEKDTHSEDLKSLLNDQGDLGLEPQQTGDTSNRVDGRADYTRPDSSLLHQALTNGATNQHDNMLQLPICQNELMHFASTMAGKLDATELPNSPQPEAPIDPMECRLALLDHIEHSQQLIDSRLSSFEAQVAENPIYQLQCNYRIAKYIGFTTGILGQEMNGHPFDTDHNDPDKPHTQMHKADFDSCYSTDSCNAYQLRRVDSIDAVLNKDDDILTSKSESKSVLTIS
uniref:PHD finger protein 20 n=1 Tax=Timema genevievae TaxID=629358 RepID=A0A7R9JW88_TIMGE|nr:unnamed protein product [Timema genevievae]